MQWAYSCSLISNIEGATDHYFCLQNHSRRKYKTFTLYHSIECYTVRKRKQISYVSTLNPSNSQLVVYKPCIIISYILYVLTTTTLSHASLVVIDIDIDMIHAHCGGLIARIIAIIIIIRHGANHCQILLFRYFP